MAQQIQIEGKSMADPSAQLSVNGETHRIGAGRRVVALHGFHATLASCRRLMPLLPDRALWLFDLKGHGASPCPADGKYTVRDQADLVLARILEEDLRELTLVGHSFGGGVALLVAIALVKEGNRLTRLVLVDSLAFPDALSWWARLFRRFLLLAYRAVPLFPRLPAAAACAGPTGVR